MKPRDWWTSESRLASCDCLTDTPSDPAFEPFQVVELKTVTIALKQSRNALLACANSVDPRSPAGKELKLALEMIKEILE